MTEAPMANPTPCAIKTAEVTSCTCDTPNISIAVGITKTVRGARKKPSTMEMRKHENITKCESELHLHLFYFRFD